MSADVLNFPKRSGIGDAGPLLGPGAKGKAVLEVQGLLQNRGYDVNADSIYGSQTQAAVKKFQQDTMAARLKASETGEAAYPIRTDGIVDKQTYDALAQGKSTTNPNFSDQSGANTNYQTYQPTSRPGVQQGGSAASFYAPLTKVYGGRPLWQWGLVAAGIVGALYWLHTQVDGPVGGYKHLIKDVTPKSHAKHPGTEVIDGKCRRVPNSGKLNTAEPLEAVA